ncbi:hypothetical protein ACFVZH_05490 [Streptomyces sp. NPDC059534]|uniref:DUF7144 family membrane protein n=1 Tax=Streptomyces sp. NPDC059534 TaxID=3346859 RepID=UPI00367A38AD
MSQHTPTGGQGNAGTAPRKAQRSESGIAGGGTVFAAVLLSVSGVMAVLQGIAAIAEDDVYARLGSYVFEFNLTAWGWIHVVLGAVVVLTAVGLFMGSNAARAAGICLVSLSLIANFLWLPYQPWWAITIMAIDVFIVWALCASWTHTAD